MPSRPAREAKERFEYDKNMKEYTAKARAGDKDAGMKAAALVREHLKILDAKEKAKQQQQLVGAVTGPNSRYGAPLRRQRQLNETA